MLVWIETESYTSRRRLFHRMDSLRCSILSLVLVTQCENCGKIAGGWTLPTWNRGVKHTLHGALRKTKGLKPPTLWQFSPCCDVFCPVVFCLVLFCPCVKSYSLVLCVFHLVTRSHIAQFYVGVPGVQSFP
jgi:hypothetical protein